MVVPSSGSAARRRGTHDFRGIPAVPWMLGVLGPPWLAVHTPNTIREDPKMSADVMSRSGTTPAVVPDSSTREAVDNTRGTVAHLLSGCAVRVSPKPLSPAVERVFDSLYWSTGLGRDRVSAEALALALIADRGSSESVTTPMVGNHLSRMRNAFYYWPQTLVDALESEANLRGWSLPVLVEYLTAHYVVGWAADLARQEIEPLRVAG